MQKVPTPGYDIGLGLVTGISLYLKAANFCFLLSSTISLKQLIEFEFGSTPTPFADHTGSTDSFKLQFFKILNTLLANFESLI